MFSKINILGFYLSNYTYSDLLELVKNSIKNNQSTCISYVNFYVFLRSLKYKNLKSALQKITFLHPDGLGIFLASKFLYGKYGFKEKINGTDFYFQILKLAIQNKCNIF